MQMITLAQLTVVSLKKISVEANTKSGLSTRMKKKDLLCRRFEAGKLESDLFKQASLMYHSATVFQQKNII